MEEVLIVEGVRTPVGRIQGGLSGYSATELGAIAVAELIRRSQLDPASIDECIMGNVLGRDWDRARRHKQLSTAPFLLKLRP